MLTDYFAAGTVDSIYQEAARCLQSRRTTQTMGKNQVRFDRLLRKAGSRMRMGGSLPENSVCVSFVQTDFTSWSDKSLALASVRAKRELARLRAGMRRLSGPFGGTARRDVSAVAGLYVKSGTDDYPA